MTEEGKPPEEAAASLRRAYVQQVWLGVVGLALAATLELIADGTRVWPLSIPFAGFGIGFLVSGLTNLRRGAFFGSLMQAHNLIEAGRMAEAISLLDQLDRCDVSGIVRGRELLRALLAMGRGDLAEVLRRVDAVIERRSDFGEQAVAAEQHVIAHGLRAWARAALADIEGARADIQQVRSAASPTIDSLARASLAEALILEQAGDRPSLGALLRRDRRLLGAALTTRERRIVRALQRTLNVSPQSVYRTPDVARSAKDETGPVTDWLERVTPRLREFGLRNVGLIPRSHANPAPSLRASRRAVQSAATAMARASLGGRGLGLLGWIGLIAVLVGAWQLLAGGPSVGGVAPLVVVAIGLFWEILRRKKQARRLQYLTNAVVLRENVDAELEQLSRSRAAAIATRAEVLRAVVADQRADFHAVLKHVEAARGYWRGDLGARALSLPTLGSIRAEALAALGRVDEAAAELEQLPADFPYLDRARFSVHLNALVARADLEGAGRLVRATSPDISMGPRDELVRDLIRVVTSESGVSDLEVARLRQELREDDEARMWIRRVSPTLLSRFEGTEEEGDQEEAAEEEDAAAEELEERTHNRPRRAH